MEKARRSRALSAARRLALDTIGAREHHYTRHYLVRKVGIIGEHTHTRSRPRGCVCRFLLINFKTLRIFFRAGARGYVGG